MKRPSKARSAGRQDTAGDLEAFRQSYAELFGVVPPLPEARMAFSGTVAAEFALLAEQIRAHALAPQGMFDVKLIQMICFGMLLVEGHEAAYWHALAARRNGASWQELHKIVELATAITSGFGALNRGGALLAKLRKEESAAPKDARPA